MNLCTLFDRNYVDKGIALYLSIKSCASDFTLYVMAMDRECYYTLKTLSFEGLHVECIEDVEQDDLREARQNRSRAEYCWTCGSYVTEYFFSKYHLPNITYLDSDLLFFTSPSIVEEEINGARASVGLSPHFINNPLFGKYCVQYVYFNRDADGEACLLWWKRECLKWCYSKLEDGKYGDQKYLDYMDQYFNNVYEIQNRGVGIANWNQEQYHYDEKNGSLTYKGEVWPIVFFHFNGVRIRLEEGRLVMECSKYFTRKVTRVFLRRYASLLVDIHNKYLGDRINGYDILPQNRAKNIMDMCWIHVRSCKICVWAERRYFEHKYSQRVAPYSER